MSQKLFTLGPVEMYEYTKERTLGPLPYFRTEVFSQVNLECARRLKRLTGAPENAHVFLLTCSGTGAMEAVVGGCFCGEDRLLVVDGGGFGHRFAEIAARRQIPYEAVSFGAGEAFAREGLDRAAKGGNFTGMLVNLHESTTGRLYDKEELASFCRAHGMYFIVDAISSFLADPLDFELDGADALIISSQKALALPPGLAIAILSDRLWQKIQNQGIEPFSLYFDFIEAEANAIRGQTPFTPAVGLILALRDRLEHIEEEGGTAAAVARTKALAEDFRSRMEILVGRGLLALPGYPLSNACTPILFPAGGAKKVYERLFGEYGVWLNPSGGELADKALRVGHIGNLTPDDNAMLAGLLADILA